MSSSVSATTVSASSPPGISFLSSGRDASNAVPLSQFREIHKNTWLKRLSADGKKILVGPKRTERSWVVFCIHDDAEALLEGYAEPRHAATHQPEWYVSLGETLHISHALIPNSHEFEFVITLKSEVLRFHTMSWEIMQEWVETLRLKLREMKILSPRENIYTKLPEVRLPLLPTRDPTSPLPAPPPVPAAIVPGVEHINQANTHVSQDDFGSWTELDIDEISGAEPNAQPVACESIQSSTLLRPSTVPHMHQMSNTLTQNLLNMLSDPVSIYSGRINDRTTAQKLNQTPAIHNPVENTRDSLASQLNNGVELSNNCTQIEVIGSSSSSREDTGPTSSKNNAEALKVKSSQPLIQPKSPDAQLGIIHSIDDITPSTSLVSIISREKNIANSRTSNVTIIQVSSNGNISDRKADDVAMVLHNRIESENIGKSFPKLPTVPSKKVVAELSRLPDPKLQLKAKQDYKSNVQIIPSGEKSNTIQVLDHSIVTVSSTTTSVSHPSDATSKTKLNISDTSELPRITSASTYGTCYSPIASDSQDLQIIKKATPKALRKIILSANTSGVTNITVNSDVHERESSVIQETVHIASIASLQENSEHTVQAEDAHYEKVFLSTRLPIAVLSKSENNKGTISDNIQSPSQQNQQMETELNSITIQTITEDSAEAGISNATQLVTPLNRSVLCKHDSPILLRRNLSPPNKSRHQLTRGSTEIAITSRLSRKDTQFLNCANKDRAIAIRPANFNNNDENSIPTTSGHASSVISRFKAESVAQRRRSSSTSDAAHQPGRTRTRNNNLPPRNILGGAMGMQQSPHHLSSSDNDKFSVRFTLREQQVIQLKREIMHPGGVRLQLRRKDCLGSIAWIDAFGAVWIAGWKQKEYPVLFNAIHIGDQLISIAGVPISHAAEANKVIRNASTLFVEILVRRIPFGSVFAIRRERDGQCLGLIRDGNTSTIVDVVPNSLADKHGLPPKAQSCDGSSLTFWVLSEINGRPLNLFFKDNEIKDRLNAVGRDISILVQPIDLIIKLKKQLKSFRSYKDYLVQ